jgi:hypothetical protein
LARLRRENIRDPAKVLLIERRQRFESFPLLRRQ